LKNGEGVNSVRRYVYRPEKQTLTFNQSEENGNMNEQAVQPTIATTIALPHSNQPVAVPIQSPSAVAASVPEPSEQEKQLAQLNARWKEIARQYAGSPRWNSPSDYTWTRLLDEVPFIVLYSDVLVRLAQFSDCVRADAITYLKMIVANDGAKFAAKRGLALPDAKLVEDEDDNVALTFVSQTGGTLTPAVNRLHSTLVRPAEASEKRASVENDNLQLVTILRQRTTALTVADVAQLLQVSPETIYRQVRRGLLPALRFGDAVRIDPTQLADWLVTTQQLGDVPCKK
jgi:excisionase family DNA binding protein